MRDVLHLEVEQFLSAAADDLAIAIVDADEAARQVDLAAAGGRLVDQGRQMRLAFPQRLLGPLSLGDLALRRMVEAGIVDADGGLGGAAGPQALLPFEEAAGLWIDRTSVVEGKRGSVG